MQLAQSSRNTRRRTRAVIGALAGLSVSVAGIHSSSAAALKWDPSISGTGSDGAGTWTDGAVGGAPANWSNGSTDVLWLSSDPDSAVFPDNSTSTTAASAATVTLGSAVTAAGLTFNVPTAAFGNVYTIAGSSTNALTISAGGSITANAAATISAPLVDSAQLLVGGTSPLTLGGSNAGLAAGISLTSGTLAATTSTSVLGGGTLSLGGGTTFIDSITGLANTVNLSSGNALMTVVTGGTYAGQLTGAGTLTVENATNTYTGTVTLSNVAQGGYTGTLSLVRGSYKLGTSANYSNATLALQNASNSPVTNDAIFSGTGTSQIGAITGMANSELSIATGATVDITKGTVNRGLPSTGQTDGGASIVAAGAGAILTSSSGTLTFGGTTSASTNLFTLGASGSTNLTIADSSASTPLSLAFDGNYTTTIYGANTYTGGTTVNTGTLVLPVANGIKGALVINGGALQSLDPTTTSSTADTNLVLASITSIAVNSGGTLQLYRTNGGGNLIDTQTLPTVTVAGGTIQTSSSLGSLTTALKNAFAFSGNSTINESGGSYTNSITSTGAISGSGTLAFQSSGGQTTATGYTHSLTLSGNGSGFAGNWNLTGTNSNQLTNLISDAVSSLGTGTVMVGADSTLSATAALAKPFDSLAGVSLTSNSATFAASAANGWNNTSATLAMSAGAVNLGTASTPGTFAIGSLNQTGGTITLIGPATLSLAGGGTSSSTIAGVTGVLMLNGGALTLSGTNTYGGGTTVSAGTLLATADSALGAGNVTVASGATLQESGGSTSNYIADAASLYLSSSSTDFLNYSGTDVISALYFNGTQQAAGTWGGVGSGATNQSAIFTGAGLIDVTSSAVPEPVSATSLGTIATAALLRRRRRDR